MQYTKPDHNIDPRKKDSKWIMENLRHFYHEFRQGGWNAFHNAKDRYHTNKLYAHGNQPTGQYRKGLNEAEDAETSWLNIDEKVLGFMPKVRRMALSKVNEIGYDITANPIDPLAEKDRKMFEAKTRTNIQLKQQLQGLQGLDLSSLQDSPDEPQTEEELEIKMKWGWKHNKAIEMEQWIDTIFFHNDYEDIRRKVRADIFDKGVAAVREYTDVNGAVRLKYCKPENMIVSYSEDERFADIVAAGEILLPTIAEVREQFPDVSEDQWAEIAAKHTGKYGNPGSWSGKSFSGYDYDECRIEVFDGAFLTVNERVHEKRTTKEGNKIVGKADWKKEGEKYTRTKYQAWYQGSWIVGTEHVYNDGMVHSMVRPKGKLGVAKSPFHIHAPELYDGMTYAIMDQCIPIIDEICRDWYRLQNAKAHARASHGIWIDPVALNETAFSGGSGDEGKYTPAELIDMFMKRNVLVANSIGGDGERINIPIQEIKGGLGDDALRWWEQINNNMNLLRTIIGFNEITDGSNVDPRTGKAVSEKMFDSTNTALQHIVDSEKSISLSLATSICIRVQSLVKKGYGSIYEYALGKESIQALQNDPALSNYDFAIKLIDTPTEEDRAWLEENINLLIANGKIDLRSASIVRSTKNLKLAEQLLAHYQKRYEDEQHQRSLELQQKNAEVQQQSGLAVEQAKQQTMQMKIQGDLQVEQLKGQNKLQEIREKGKYEAMVHGMKIEGAIEQTDMTNESKEYQEALRQISKGQQVNRQLEVQKEIKEKEAKATPKSK